MPLPTERISLNRSANATIRTGLDRIVNRFAEIQATNRRSLDSVDSRLKTKLQPRFLADGIYELILSLRNRLMCVATKSRSKHRFTVTEYAVLAFAVRIARRIRKAQNTKELERRLEVFRKRAKRRAIARVGMTVYKTEARKWICSSRWIRFGMMPVRLPRRSFGQLSIYREQHGSMLRLATLALTERCTEMPPRELVSKTVKLAIEEIRRGRYPGIKVRKLIADSARGKQFLFEFIRKRMDKSGSQLHLKFEYQPKCVQMSIRAEKFSAAMVVRDSIAPPRMVETTLAAATESPIPHETPRLDIQDVAIVRRTVSSESVADWLINDVEPEFWEDIIAEAKHQLDLNIATRSKISPDIEVMQRASRPTAERGDAPEYINVGVEWLFNWTLAIESDRDRLRCIFTEGLRLARDSYKPLDNQPRRIDGVRYIEGIMDGTLRT